jgi:hypothetical protein
MMVTLVMMMFQVMTILTCLVIVPMMVGLVEYLGGGGLVDFYIY